jgi:hypothetical protein
VQPPPIAVDCELIPCGSVSSVIGALATVKAIPDVQPVDAVRMLAARCRWRVTVPLQGTVICRSDRTALAVVEDVFGPVSAPMYLLRFASQTVMEELLVQPGLQLFYPKVPPLPLFCFGIVSPCEHGCRAKRTW